ncbi:profilin [Favolaschia claudopus]|uniref:Profilin n=1 Tax=Favolaschia claudopus TaxID=2862362 RepID=A0AAW0BAY7_9AGAR
MSWQSYVDTNLVASGKISRAAILGKQGGVWATSAGYTLSPDEQKAILGAFNDLDSVRGSGLHLAGVKYFTTKADERSIYGKKGSDGYVIVPTKQAIIVAEYSAPTQAPEAVGVAEPLADYLIGVDY